jgi:methylase of polypeptide subunit release factors
VTVNGAKFFRDRDLERLGQILRSLSQGDLVVVEGPWPAIRRVYDHIVRRRSELVKETRETRLTGEQWERARQTAVDRLLTPPPAELRELLGDDPIPVRRVLQAQEGAGREVRVEALGGASVLAPPPVFPPRSPETYLLLRQALEGLKDILPPGPTVLDVGCGAGVCGFIAARVLAPGARIVATDVLPDALRATRVNALRLELPGTIEVTPGGDLFEPVAGRRFDLLIFNPPWAVAQVHNAAELAVNDPERELLSRFLEQAPDHLTPEGRLLLVYGNTSRTRSLPSLETMIAEAGFVPRRRLTARIKTHRQQRAWEAIFVYDLGRK